MNRWIRRLSTGRQDLAHCLSSLFLLYYTRNHSIRPSHFPHRNVVLSLSNLPLIISVASPTSSHPLLFLYWHCHRHRPCPTPPSPCHPIHLITSTLLFHRSTFLTLSLSPSSPLSPHPSPRVRVSGHPAGRFITATWQPQSTLPSTYTHTHTYTHLPLPLSSHQLRQFPVGGLSVRDTEEHAIYLGNNHFTRHHTYRQCRVKSPGSSRASWAAPVFSFVPPLNWYWMVPQRDTACITVGAVLNHSLDRIGSRDLSQQLRFHFIRCISLH